MKKISLLVLTFAYCIPLFTLGQSSRKGHIASPHQISQRHYPLTSHHSTTIEGAGVALSQHKKALDRPANARIAAVSPAQMGTSGNAFTFLRCEQNQVVAVDSLDLVAFIHRSNPNTFGGSSSDLRYDLSINGGLAFTNDIGVLNPLLTQTCRYPNLSALNFSGGSNPLNSHLVFYAAAQGSSGNAWDGHLAGIAQTSLGGPINGTEHYLFTNTHTSIPGGLCQANPGIFWTTDFVANTFGNPTGEVRVYRGEFNISQQDILWQISDTISPSHCTTFNGDIHALGPNIAFSPNGEIGWVAWLGDLTGGPDSTYLPVFSKTTDCGVTWSLPVEVNLNNIPWIADSLQTLWEDSLGNPASNGRATCTFDYDLTVDANGNPHLGVVIATGIDYGVSSGLAKFLGDVTTNNGGTTWKVTYISPILTLRTNTFGTPPGETAMDNQVQVARDEGGCTIFFCWADSDTSIVTGNQLGVGFGESTNLSPNLRVAAYNVSNGLQTYPQLITDTDLLWGGQILFPSMAPIVLSDANGWKLPIVTITLTNQDPLLPASFWYFGNDAVVPNSGWCNPSAMTLSWDYFGSNSFVSPCSPNPVAFCNKTVTGSCIGVGIQDPVASEITLGEALPNPAMGQALVSFSLPAAATVQLSLHNHLGQCVAMLANGEFGSGRHEVGFSTQGLAAGLYHYRLQSGDVTVSKKLIVAR